MRRVLLAVGLGTVGLVASTAAGLALPVVIGARAHDPASSGDSSNSGE